MKVKNIPGTASKTCKCGSWLQHWLNFSRQQKPQYCSVTNCYQTPTVGAHVQKYLSLDYDHYIIPMCIAHNMSPVVLSIKQGVAFVSANKKKTCDR